MMPGRRELKSKPCSPMYDLGIERHHAARIAGVLIAVVNWRMKRTAGARRISAGTLAKR